MKLTHPDKIWYAEDKITKQQLYDYYEEFHDLILPYVIKRPLTLLRCPADYHHCFYQKHPGDYGIQENLFTIKIREKLKSNHYIYIKDKAGLLQLLQWGVLEIHPWGSTIHSLEKPDMLIFDLDPGPDVAWKKVVKIAMKFEKVLRSIELKCFLKSTGGKGLHIVIPIVPANSWNKVKAFAKSICEYVAMENQEVCTLNMKKTERKGKIFLDYLRNQKGATAIAPYSTRARIHAPVATPIDWDELTNNMHDTQYTLKNIKKRLRKIKKDPWEDFLSVRQFLPADKL